LTVPAGRIVLFPIGTERIVFFPFFVIGKNLVRFAYTGEFRSGVFIGGIDVGMVFSCQFPVLFFQLFFSDRFLEPENLVVIFIFH